MKVSSPLMRKTFLGSPGLLAKPKNFRGIGGAADTTGGWYSSAFLTSVAPVPSGFWITTSSACATKIFLPEPSYLIASVEASCCKCRVGSRLCGGGSFFPGVELRRGAGWAALAGDACEPVVAAGAVEAMVEEEGMNS